MVYIPGFRRSLHLEANLVANRNGLGCNGEFDCYTFGCLAYTERTFGVNSRIRSHILLKPSESRTFLAVPHKARSSVISAVLYPSVTVNPTPKSYTCHIVGFPHYRELFFVTGLESGVVFLCYVVLGNVLWQLGFVVDIFQGTFELGSAHVVQVVSLVSSSVNWGAAGFQTVDEVDELGLLPLEGVVVVVNQNGFRPAFASQTEGLGNPLVRVRVRVAVGTAVVARTVAGLILCSVFCKRT